MIPVVEINGGRFYPGLQMCRYERIKREQTKIDRLLASAKVPEQYSHDSFADYKVNKDNEAAVRAAKWVISGAKGLFLYGPRGTGKTKLASIIANEKAHNGHPVLFSSVPDLLSDIRATFESEHDTSETVRMVREIGCLILDDLGSERMTDWVGEQLFSILNYRYNERLQTIVTSNYNSRDIIQHMAKVNRAGNVVDDAQSQRIMSRIGGMCEFIQISGKDYRMSGK